MKLYIDMHKSVLNLSKLVKKPVQVRGKDGKVFTRMQWVNPHDASTGHGVRMIHSKQGLESAKKDGIDKHPHFQHAMKEQGVHEDTFEDHHPHFFLPETEESAKNYGKRLIEIEREHGYEKVMDDQDHNYHYEHGWEVPEHMNKVYGEHELVPKMSDEEYDSFLRKNNIHPEIHSIVSTISNKNVKGQHPQLALKDIEKDLVMHHKHIIHSHVESHIKENTEDRFVRNVQLGALKQGRMFLPGLHPHIARSIVDTIMGKELANTYREKLKHGNLSVNFLDTKAPDIQKNGYVASTIESYLEKNGDEDDLERYEEILETDYEDEEERIDALQDINYSLYERASAEYNAIGLHVEDRKPTYIAYNPDNNPSGAAIFYGRAWLKVTDESNVLNHSTATLDDSFNESRSVAKIFNKEHLQELFLLKLIDSHPYMSDIIQHGAEGLSDEDLFHRWDIPIELQYHQPKLSPDQFEIMTPVTDTSEQKHDPLGLDDLDDLSEEELKELGDLEDLEDLEDFSDVDDLDGLDDLDLGDSKLDDVVDDSSDISWDDLFEHNEK